MSRRASSLVPALGCLVLGGTATAQFGNAWLRYAPDQARVRDAAGVPAAYVTGDPQEKDMAVGDLDQDGWTDLVIVRKQPNTTTGAFPNWLLMNEGGLLVDRSAQYASATDVPGDQGFLTPTNDRDVVVVDVDLDGWLDVVTSTALGANNPKHITHPRVYVNLGDDAAGNWLGLRFEDARIPTMTPQPTFCAVAAGDVTGDGSPDLYFADYGALDDRLLINDGNGFFSDSGTSRMSAAMLASGFGHSAAIVDLNLDGARDVVRGQAFSAQAAYNDPANEGFFPISHTIHSGSTYHVAVGDLNNDARPDAVFSEDGGDKYRFNTGVDVLGRVVWGPAKSFQFLTGGDDSIAGTNMVVDLDQDGWQDVIITDVDVDFSGCSRRAHVYHNLGGTPGSETTLLEEAEAASGGWRGVAGILPGDLQGSFDVAVLDLDNDDDLDLVLGRCSGTFVWINQAGGCPASPYEFGAQVANSTGLPGRIGSSGSSSLSADDLVLTATDLPANKTCLFLYGTTRLWNPAPFGNGLRFIAGSIQRLPVTTSDANGHASFAADLAAFPLSSLNAGDVRDFQLWFRDPAAGGANYNASDALEIVFCP